MVAPFNKPDLCSWVESHTRRETKFQNTLMAPKLQISHQRLHSDSSNYCMALNTNKIKCRKKLAILKKAHRSIGLYDYKLQEGRDPAFSLSGLCPRPGNLVPAILAYELFLSISFESSEPFNSIGDVKPMRSWWLGCVLPVAMALKFSSVLLSLMTADLVNPAGVRLPRAMCCFMSYN